MGANTQSAPASSNWLALQKSMPKSTGKHKAVSAFVARKRRKLEHTAASPAPAAPNEPSSSSAAFSRGPIAENLPVVEETNEIKNGESLSHLRKMVYGQVEYPAAHTQPGRYVALDCEMVGVGIEGAESALARVSIVNFYGHILLDAIVRPRERVVDYRTEFSGIRSTDMVHARTFEDVVKETASILKDRILVGHAVHNDLKALLLSHPRPQTRDTQLLAYKHKVSRGRRPALRHLVRQELGLSIQGGEHSSVTDARATMALFRLHRKTWEKGVRPIFTSTPTLTTRSQSPSAGPSVPKKRRRATSADSRSDEESAADQQGSSDSEDDAKHDARRTPSPTRAIAANKSSKTRAKTKAKAKVREMLPGGGRRGVSSGLSTVVKRVGGSHMRASAKGKSAAKGEKKLGKAKAKEKWWKELGGRGSAGSKGSMSMRKTSE